MESRDSISIRPSLTSTVPYAALADLLLLLHGAFVLFVIGGGLLVLRWPRLMWMHLPAALWGAGIEFSGLICPLTPLEQAWRRVDKRGGQLTVAWTFGAGGHGLHRRAGREAAHV